MKRAWNFFRTHKCTFAIALKIAWDEFKIELRKAVRTWVHTNNTVDESEISFNTRYYANHRYTMD